MKKIKEKQSLNREENERLSRLVAGRTPEPEQEQLELALKESETKFRTLFTQMNEGFAHHEVVYDLNHKAVDYKILDINNAFEKQIGISHEKAKGALATQLYGVSPAPFLDIYVHVAETGEPHFFETYFPPLGKHFEISVFSPNRGYFATIFTDITERKKTENALRESEEKWRKLVQTIPDYIALYDRDGKYLFLNHFAEGFSMKDIEGKIYTDFLADDSKTSYESAFRQAKETGQNQYFEYTAFGDNFTLRNYENYFVPIFENNQFVNMLVIARDITERKRMEEALRESEEIFNQFMEHSPIYIFFKDENIRSMRLSRNYEKLLGKKLDELLGKSMNELFPSDLAKQMVEDDLRILKLGEKVEIEEELNNRCYSTLKFPIQVEGKPRFLAGFTMDITERKLAEEALKENEARLREAVATRDKFFSIIAHDLKNPFNSILGFSDLLAEQVSNKNYEGIEEYSAIIQNSSQRVMNLLMNLLEWSRSQTGRMEYNPEFVELHTLINQAHELMEDAAHQKSITIELQIPQNFRTIADKAMISTTLRNLISNAVKFTNPGGLITVSVGQKEEELIVSIADNGVGIKKELIDKLFKVEGSNSTEGTHKEKGTGLGLILCKEFIGKHGGRIWAESELGKGSTFYFTLPLGNS